MLLLISEGFRTTQFPAGPGEEEAGEGGPPPSPAGQVLAAPTVR